MSPDPWQRQVLRPTHERTLTLCSRQAGKSQVAGGLAVLTALLEPNSLILLLSPTLRQSGELFRDKVMRLYNAAARHVVPPVQSSALTLTLTNGSRIISLPGDEGTIRGYSGVKLLVIDEASRVPDNLYRAVRPMLAVSKGKLICMTTPWGKRGWFYDEWEGTNNWQRIRITADMCPRITPEFLEEEKKSLGDRWFNQEFWCSFEDVVDAVFAEMYIQAALRDAPAPLWGAG